LVEQAQGNKNRAGRGQRQAHEIAAMEATLVKPLGLMSATGLLLLLGCAASANGKQEPQEKQEKQDQQEKQEQAAKPPKHEEQAKPEKRQDQAKGQEQQRQQEDKSAKQEQKQQAKGQQEQQRQQQDKSAKQGQKEQARGQQEQQQQHQQQARPSQPPQRTQQAEARQRAQPELRLTARGGGRISDDRFRSHFGREHTFRVGDPVLVGGYSRFQYGGYWFGFVEPWPSGWYYTDDVYIDYVDDGYYMYDPYYPGTRFAISVVL